MDIKLTKNKMIKDFSIIALVTLVIFFSISLKRAYVEYTRLERDYGSNYLNNRSAIDSIKNMDDSILEYIGLYKDIDGNKKEDVYNQNIEGNKRNNEERLKEVEKEIRENAKEDNLSEEQIKEQIKEKKKSIWNDESNIEHYYGAVQARFKRELSVNFNIEFFVKDSEGNIITNINEGNFEDRINTGAFTYDNGYYYIYYPNLNSSFSENLYSADLDSLYKLLNAPINSTTRFYRIPKEPHQGDTLYAVWSDRENNIRSIYINSIIAIICAGLILVITFVLYKNRKNKEMAIIEKLYIKIPIDVRLLIFMYSLVSIKDLVFNIIPYYSFNWYCIGGIINAIALIVLDLYLLKDLVLIMEGKKKLGKISLFKLYNFIKSNSRSNSFIKSNKFKSFFIILSSILALFSLCLEFYYNFNYIPPRVILFYRSYLCVYIISASIMSFIIVREVRILEAKTLEVSNGNYKYDLKGNKVFVLKNIENNLNTIEDGLKEALDKAIVSEKMKSELITNVSHDLKTPLTSIINYIDLLKDEDIPDEKRKKYLEVLDMKSKRLKVLIEDLFEASKAVSGNMSFEKEELNIVSLLRQVIGELEEKINQADLDVITKWPEEKAILYLDGRKTFRVYENLINNIIKYSMKNSRVYIDVINDENEVIVVLKNISAYQIDFTSREIVERFKRGDESRTTEGSGLGLSIAKSIVELQGGEFNIEIDGDLFKVTTRFKK